MSTERLALVTGGARGIGYACAEALKEDGYDVILCDIDADGVAAAAERLGAVAGIACDMADADAVLAMFDRIEAEHGRVSALVNNAGVAMPGDFLDYDLAAFDAVIAINLRGTFVATQRAAKTMVANGIKGAIVNMSSINAQLAIPAIPAYCASKGGVMQLTKVAALALAPKGIRVNAVGPGSIDTDMMAGVNANAEALKRVLSRTPLGRVGSAREIGDVVAFLCSEKASYITGETIYVDGGASVPSTPSAAVRPGAIAPGRPPSGRCPDRPSPPKGWLMADDGADLVAVDVDVARPPAFDAPPKGG
jgi:glucose 1-dehydrogenase